MLLHMEAWLKVFERLDVVSLVCRGAPELCEVLQLITCIQSFITTRSCQFGNCFYRKLQPEYITYLGWMAAVALPTNPSENQNHLSLKPTERAILKLCSLIHTLRRTRTRTRTQQASGRTPAPERREKRSTTPTVNLDFGNEIQLCKL